MKAHVLFIFAIVSSHQPGAGQSIFVLAKAGVSSYGAVYVGGLGGGGGGDHNWKTGPILSAGVRLRSSEGFALDGAIEYSTHRYDGNAWESVLINDPRNSVLEITTIGRSSFQIIRPVHFGFLYGLGVSYQHREAFVRSIGHSQTLKPSDTNVTGCIVLGTALEVRVPSNLEFTLEGCLRGRRYVTPSLELGVAYLL
jgi:hypothetical protein